MTNNATTEPTNAPTPETPENPYGAKRVRKGLLHFAAGKAFTSVAGIGTMVVLVRELPLADFAVYSVLFGLVELMSAITGMGLLHIMSRYVPEAHSTHQNGATRRLIIVATSMRLAVLAAVLAVLYLTATDTAPLIGLDGWVWAMQAYLWVILARVVAMTLFGVLESLLRQGIAQLGFSTVTIVRFALLIGVAALFGLDLKTVIVIEVVTDLLGIAIMLTGLVRVLPVAGSAGGGGWIRANLPRMLRFGAKGYAQHMLLVPFGGPTDRLLVGARLSTPQVAMFGFAQQVADLMERYLPAQMFVGLIRPVLTARFSSGNGFSELVTVCNMVLKLNLFLIGGAAVCLFAGGESFIYAVIGDKDFDGIVPLILLICLMVSLYSWRHILDMVTHTVERNGPLIVAHAIMNISVIPGFLLMPYWGVFALPVSHVVGVTIGCLALLAGLARAGYRFTHDLAGFSRLALSVLGAFALAWLLDGVVHWAVRIVLCGLFYMVLNLVLQTVRQSELVDIKALLKKDNHAPAKAAEPRDERGEAAPQAV